MNITKLVLFTEAYFNTKPEMQSQIQLMINGFFHEGFNISLMIHTQHREWLEAQMKVTNNSIDFKKYIIEHFKHHVITNKTVKFGIRNIGSHFWLIDEVFFNHCIRWYNRYIITKQINMPTLKQYQEFFG